MKKINLYEVTENNDEWDAENKSSSAYRLLVYISHNEGLFVNDETLKNLCENFNSGIANQLFDSLVNKGLIYQDYIPPSPRDKGWFLTEKGKALLAPI